MKGPGSGYDFGKLPESYTNSLMAGIIGFQMQIELLEGKFKLGQERSEADRQSMLKNLASAKRRALDLRVHRRFLQARIGG